MQVLISIVAFLIVVSVLITVHEWGHFFIARLFRVPIRCFSIGFGKPLITWHGKSGTDYMISAIPLGGYVKMEDSLFEQRSPLTRMMIILAGPGFNFIFAFFALWLMFLMGVQGIIPIIGQIRAGSVAEKIGLQADQRILTVDGKNTPTWSAVKRVLTHHTGKSGLIPIQVMGKRGIKDYYLSLRDWPLDREGWDILAGLGLQTKMPPLPSVIKKVIIGMPAYRAGMQKEDKVIRVNGQPVHDFNDITRAISDDPNHLLQLTVLRRNQIVQLVMMPKNGLIGIESQMMEWPKDLLYVEHFSIWESFQNACSMTWEITKLSLSVLYKIITGHLPWQFLGGPVSIAKGAGMSIKMGFSAFLRFLALISIGLGVVNLLPIPVLDGGYLVYYVAELVRGRPLSKKIQEIGIKIGLLILLVLITLAFFNDLTQW